MVLWGCSPSCTKSAAVLTFWGKPLDAVAPAFPSGPNLYLLAAYSSLTMPLKSVSEMPRSFLSSEVWFPQSLTGILWEWLSKRWGRSSQGRFLAGWGCSCAALTSENVSCEMPELQQDKWPWGGADWPQLPLGSVLVCPWQFMAHPAAGKP